MQGAALLQLNIPSSTSYSFLFTEWTGKKKNGQAINPAFAFADRKRLTSSMLLMLSEIREGSIGREKPKLTRHKYFMDKFGLCIKTVRKNLAELIRLGLIESCGRSRYRLIIENLSNHYILIEDFYFGKDWKIGATKRLTFSAVIVLEYIISMYTFLQKRGKPFVRSQKKLASGLNFAPSTVADALKELVDAKLLKRYKATPIDGYADNIEDTDYIIDYTEEGVGDGYSLTAFKPNEELLKLRQQLEDNFRGQVAADAPSAPFDTTEGGASEHTKRGEKKQKLRKLSNKKRNVILPKIYNLIQERHYAADLRAERVQEAVYSAPTCKTLYMRVKELTIPLGRAMAYNIEEEVKKLLALQDELQRELDAAIKNRLAELGKTEADLKPRYCCRYCEDTGRDPHTGKHCKCVSAELAKIGYKL